MKSKEMIFEHIFKEHFDKMVSYVTLYIKDREISRNIAQESFMALWKNMDSVSSTKYVSYAYSAARNLTLNHLKREVIINRFLEHHRNSMDMLFMESLDDDGLSMLNFNEIRQVMYDTLMELREPVRNTFMHSRYGFKTNAEIAQMQGISEKLVEYRITVVLKKLRGNLQKLQLDK